ncbi:MAG: hypothetical protein ABL931_09420 [Usitatibacteraceae bacterium]
MEVASWIFFGPGKLLTAWPYAGFGAGIALIAVQAVLSWREQTLFERGFFRQAPVLAGLIWLIFNLYELQFNATNPTGKQSFRVDLIILVPILYALTVAAALSIRAQLQNRQTK